jgi:molybdopterin synthase sulfur carrier subunit
MKVTVKLFAFFRDGRFKVEDGITMINNRHCQFETLLQEGDNLAIFPVIGGG